MGKLLLIDGDFIPWRICPNTVGSDLPKTLEQVLEGIDFYMNERILTPTIPDYYLGFLGGKGNFRMSLTPTYKEGRPSERPPFFKEAKQHLVDKWGFVVVNEIEAEDAVGISLTKYPEGCIVGTDHDLKQLEGIHYNPVKDLLEPIDARQANSNLAIQLLAGKLLPVSI